VTPVVAVIVGVIFLGEGVTWNEPVGGAIVLLGAAIAQGRIRIHQTGLRGIRWPEINQKNSDGQ
jgi:drug/metabolite transporter (DMT)-like permease